MGCRVELYSADKTVHTLEDVMERWEAGKDFMMQDGFRSTRCSIRDFECLKENYDIIELKWLDNAGKKHYHNIFIHILAGVTTYVDQYPGV